MRNCEASSGKIKKREMTDRGKYEICTEFWPKSVDEIYHLENLATNGSIILE